MQGNVEYTPLGEGFIIPYVIFILLVLTVSIISMWRVYIKAARPGWASLVPIYNMVVLIQIAGKPGWWILLFFVPVLNVIIQIMIAINLAKAFGKGGAFGFFMLFLFAPIGYMILAFGNSKYMLLNKGGNVQPITNQVSPPTPTQPQSSQSESAE